MPAYSYKARFVPYILDLSKDHTVRAERFGRGRHARPGEILYQYFGMRTKWCRKLGEAICTNVEKITIWGDCITIGGRVLTWDEMNLFAWKDGFRPAGTSQEEPWGAWTAMKQFWKETNGLILDNAWNGVVIYWGAFKPED